MKRTTVVLSDELATLLELERRKRDVSAAEVIRQALAAYLGVDGQRPKPLSFIGIAEGSGEDIASRMEEILAEEWPAYLRRESGLDSDR